MRLSNKHGLNSSISLCFYCGQSKEVILSGATKGDVEAPMQDCYDKVPCDTCASHMKLGVLVCVVKDGSNQDNPYRTGESYIIKADAAEELFKIDSKKCRFVFLEESASNQLLSHFPSVK